MDEATKSQKLLQFRTPERLSDAIDTAATKNFQSKSEFIRYSIVQRLKADGIELSVTVA